MNGLAKLQEIAQARCPTCQLEALGGWDAFNKPHTHPADLKQMRDALVEVLDSLKKRTKLVFVHTIERMPKKKGETFKNMPHVRGCAGCALDATRTEIMALTEEK